jgi:hypothetical protein
MGGGMDGISYITFEGYRQAVYVNVDKSNRNANLNRLENFGNDNDWFLFRKSFLSLPNFGESFCLLKYTHDL